MQDNDSQKIIINFINKVIKTEIEEIYFDKIEKYQGISEYEFYIINIKGITKDRKEKSIFVKNIKQGKIKESLFCICDLTYERYLKSNSKKLKKISIIEAKEKQSRINNVSVKLYEDDLNTIKANINIYFIEMLELLKNNNIRRRAENIEINPKDIIIIGVET